MPRLVLMVPETHESVTRPVVLDITRELFKITGLDPSTQILYPDSSETTAQVGSQLGMQTREPQLGSHARLSIEVEEDFERDSVLADAVYQPEQSFIWRDDRIETLIKPAYAKNQITLNFRYRALDKTAALKWRDEIKTRVAMGRTQYLHTAKYHYLIPEPFLVILKELYRMREAVSPYGETWDKFFKDSLTQRATEVTTLNGQHKQWAIAESQMRILGMFDFDYAPERGGKTDEGETWTVGFTYKFQLDRPVACVMHYPLVVHNQVVARNFRPNKEDQPERVERHERSYSLSSNSFSAFEAGRWSSLTQVASAEGKTVPEYDEFIPSSVPLDTLRLFTAMVTIDTSAQGDPSFLLDLRNLGTPWSLDPKVLDFMAKITTWLPKPLYSPLVVSLYENRYLLDPAAVRVGPDLRVYATRALDLRRYYHVRLGLTTDWSLIPTEILDLLREDAQLLLSLLTAIDSRVTLSKVLSGGYVPRATLKEALDFINRATLAKGNGQQYLFSLVASLFVQAYARDKE